MNFIADLHIHSRFSRATSKALNPRHLAAWARCKGINVLGTGDFTHPQWRAELAEQLVLDENSGLYRLAVEPETLDFMDPTASPGLRASEAPLFMLQTEISSIYKRGGQVRKVHNLVFVPTLEDAERLSLRLAQIGNLNADGRPILGLDSRDLLEIMLECAPGSVMIPAHVWTPWFALFGSKSGFDRLEDCYGDLSEHIFALETGLSSDPAMNRLISRLDGYALVSNSDAHSGPNLGREANLFAGQPSYAGVFAALRASARREDQSGLDCRFLGTMEFYPDEGKYHLDGHRACNVVLEPKDSLALGNICPVCGKPLTVGVLHRVLELADRDTPAQLLHEPEVRPLIPLAEVVGEILGVGPSSRRVQERYSRLLRELGPELDILCRLPEADIRAHWEPLGEAVARMRRGQVYRQGGYDGEYGIVRVFAPEELADARGALPGVKAPARRGRKKAGAAADDASAQGSVRVRRASLPLADGTVDAANLLAVRAAAKPDCPARVFAYSAEQQAALTSGPAPVLVLAGPGAGKTRVLVGRLQWLAGQGVDMRRVLAVTFTRRAADELRERLSGAFWAADQSTLPQCDTLHGMAWAAMRETCEGIPPLLLGEDAALNLFRLANPALEAREARDLWDQLALARERASLADAQTNSPLARAATNYAARKNAGQRYVDYADLLDWWLAHARAQAANPLDANARPLHVLVDEVQDLSAVQLAIVRALLPADGTGFFGIGDPDQAIYGFRGVTGQSEASLRACWPGLDVHRLGQSFRSSQSVLDMARSLLLQKGQCGPLQAAQQLTADLRLFSAPDEHAEARWVAERVRRLLGATAHTLMDRQDPDDLHGLAGTLAPGDVAVLVRLKAQIAPLRAALEQAGIPCAAPSQDAFWQDPACARLLDMLAVACGFAQFFAESQDQTYRLPEHWAAQTMPAPEGMVAWLASQPWAGELFTSGHSWRQLCRVWKQSGSWPAFFEQLAWLREAELVRGKAEHVQILTLHASKGLEFQAVFIPGLEDGLLPLRRERLFPTEGTSCGESQQNEAEERRLLYVGLTRAARALFLSHCAQRSLYGRTLQLQPSPFIGQIREFCRHSALAEHTRKAQKQISLF
ncbi:DNA helicase [Desulfovibrio desulfuricans]|uniref:DNA helicase n=1 Tax=Desulfovibrio desulfuricans TaxID=876 RepID=A0A4P7UG81_DESDE|nr:UvrD-helicase domain-containing protein [Desulfovibrio desulfuricans]QCC84307.1 DNA helicase [Desulfovibrio desulfuricans]